MPHQPGLQPTLASNLYPSRVSDLDMNEEMEVQRKNQACSGPLE